MKNVQTLNNPHDVIEIKIPGSIANLGPGFDTLAVAVQLYITVRARRIPGTGRLEFSFAGYKPCTDNCVERAYAYLAGDQFRHLPSLSVEVNSEIPPSAGLGSSAAATVAGLRLYEAIAGDLPMQTLLNAASLLESHPDNAAASLLGGLTMSCAMSDGSVYATRFPWPESLSGDFSLLKDALNDRVHQPFRENVVPGLSEALKLQHQDLLGICLSGSGPSIVAMAERSLWEIGDLLAGVYKRRGVKHQLRILEAHQEVSARPHIFRAGLLCCS